MKAPKEIYVPLVDMGVEDGGIQPAPIWWKRDKSTEKQGCKGVIEYIRADIAELTWDDIEKIDGLIREIGQKTDIKTYQETYQEVLQRFLKSKNEIEL